MFVLVGLAAAGVGCAALRSSRDVPKPRIIPHSEWETQPPLGHAADATRRNKRAGDSLVFHDLKVNVIGVAVDSTGEKPVDVVSLQMDLGDRKDERVAREAGLRK